MHPPGGTVPHMSATPWTVPHRLDMSVAARVAYVALVSGLTTYAMADVNHVRGPAFAAALLLCLPATIPTLPFLYVILALGWNLTDADSGGTTWPVTALYVVVLGGVAIANLVVVERLWKRRTGR